MTPERIAELREYVRADYPVQVYGMGQAVSECLDTIAAQQREIDGLYGLLIAPTHYPSEGLSKRWQLNWNGAEFRTEAEARDAVRRAWEGK